MCSLLGEFLSAYTFNARQVVTGGRGREGKGRLDQKGICVKMKKVKLKRCQKNKYSSEINT